MRARYTSYATGRIDFVEKSHAPESRKDFDRKASEKWAKDSTWNGLSVVAVKGGTAEHTDGIAKFVAHFTQAGQDYQHREIATFRTEGGSWLFIEG